MQELKQQHALMVRSMNCFLLMIAIVSFAAGYYFGTKDAADQVKQTLSETK